MRLIFFSPDIDPMMGTTLNDYRNKRKSISKYSYLIKQSLKFQPNETYFYVKSGRGLLKINWLNKFKFLYWARINKYRIKWDHLLDDQSIFGDGDVLLCNSRRCLKDDSLKVFEHFTKLKKLAILDHYMVDTEKIASNSNKYKINGYLAAANLYKTSDYFKKFFSFNQQDVYVLPHVAEARFNKNVEFNGRKNKTFVSGGIAIFNRDEPYLKDFFSFFPDSVYHPMRRVIYENSNQLSSFIDHKLYVISSPALSRSASLDSLKKYHADFNMVEAYNSYKMFLAPEELSGLPAIAFIEGLNCGAVLIGKNGAIYEDLGFEDRESYIAYDGTLPDLCEKISYYQRHSKELSKIAQTGYSFCVKNFNQETVFKKFYQDLLSYVSTGQLISSFVRRRY